MDVPASGPPPHEARAGVGAPLAVAVVLALVAGLVDAVCYGRVFEVFPANQSGNAVLLGIGLGEASALDAWRPAVSILGFGVGVALGIVLGGRLGSRVRAPLLLTLEVAILVPIAIVVLAAARARPELADTPAAALLFATSIGMGIQTEVIGRVAGVGVATTYQSGAIARIAEVAASRIDERSRDREHAPLLTVLGTVLAGYVGGAAVGAALGDWAGALVVPIVVLGALVVVLAAAAVRSRVVV